MTFYHFNGVSTSQIDYILPFKNGDLIFYINILKREPGNTSTHDPVTGQIICNSSSPKANGKIQGVKCYQL